MLKQERRRAAEAEAALKDAGMEPRKAPSPILGSTSPVPPPTATTAASETSGLLSSSREMSNIARSNSKQSVSDSRGLGEQRGVQESVTNSGSQLSGDSVKLRAILKAGWSCLQVANIYRSIDHASSLIFASFLLFHLNHPVYWHCYLTTPNTELSQARQEAFDSFRRNYADTSTIDQHKRVLKAYAQQEDLPTKIHLTSSYMARLYS